MRSQIRPKCSCFIDILKSSILSVFVPIVQVRVVFTDNIVMYHSYGIKPVETSLPTVKDEWRGTDHQIHDPPVVLGSNALLAAPLTNFDPTCPQHAAPGPINSTSDKVLRGSDLYAPAPLIVPDPTFIRSDGRSVALRPIKSLRRLEYARSTTVPSTSCHSKSFFQGRSPLSSSPRKLACKICEDPPQLLLSEPADGEAIQGHQQCNLAKLEGYQRHCPRVQVLSHYEAGRSGYVAEDGSWRKPRLLTRTTGFDHLMSSPPKYYPHVLNPKSVKRFTPSAPGVLSAYRLVQMTPEPAVPWKPQRPRSSKKVKDVPSHEFPVLVRDPHGLAPGYRPYIPGYFRPHDPAGLHGSEATLSLRPAPQFAPINVRQYFQQPVEALPMCMNGGVQPEVPRPRLPGVASGNLQGGLRSEQQPGSKPVLTIAPT